MLQRTGYVSALSVMILAEGVGNLKDRDGKRISGFDFIIFVLAYWEGKPEYRWEEIHEELRLRLV